jgi:hypothetical protein
MGEIPQVCSNPEWAVLGFSVTSQNLPADALAKLKIKQHPPTSQIVLLLEKSPPKDGTEAKSWFDILSSRIHGSDSTRLVCIHSCGLSFTSQIFQARSFNDCLSYRWFLYHPMRPPSAGFHQSNVTSEEMQKINFIPNYLSSSTLDHEQMHF